MELVVPLIFAQFTDELAGLVAVGGAIAGAIRWLIIRERKREKRFRKEREARLTYQAETKAIINVWIDATTKTERTLEDIGSRVRNMDEKVQRWIDEQ